MENKVDQLLLNPEEVARALGISRTSTYELLRREELPSIKIGRSRRIPAAALRAWVDAQAGVEQGP